MSQSMSQSMELLEVFYKKVVVKNFAIFTGKHLRWSHFLIKRLHFIKKRLQHRCFPVNIAKFSRTPILKNICERLPLISFNPTWAELSGKSQGWRGDLIGPHWKSMLHLRKFFPFRNWCISSCELGLQTTQKTGGRK